ncbi:MAG: ABC transporter permease [Vampirovibrionales bacterium]
MDTFATPPNPLPSSTFSTHPLQMSGMHGIWYRFYYGTLPMADRVWRSEWGSFGLKLLSFSAQPLTFYWTFSLGLRPYLETVDGQPYWAFLFPALVANSIWNEAFSQGAWGMWLDRWHQGLVNEYRIKPIHDGWLLFGDLLGGSSIAIVKGLVVFTALLFISHSPWLGWKSLLGWLGFMVPGALLFNTLGTISGLFAPKPDYLSRLLTLVITPLLYLGGLFFPVENYPNALGKLFQWLPSTWLFAHLRQGYQASTTHPSITAWEYALPWLIVGLLWLWSIRLYQKSCSQS